MYFFMLTKFYPSVLSFEKAAFIFQGLTMRFNMPVGANMYHTNFSSQTPYIPFNLAALSAMSNQQLEVSGQVLGMQQISYALWVP